MDFAKESETMDMKQEMMNDVIDDVMDDDEDEEESNQIMNQVLDEIGIDVNQKLADAPLGNLASKEATPAEVDDLEARLNMLRKE